MNENTNPLSSMMQTDRSEDADMPVTKAATPDVDPNFLFRQATGLSMDLGAALTEQQEPRERVLTPDEAAQFGPGEKIDIQKEINENRNKKAEEMLSQKSTGFEDTLKAAIEEEESRDKRHAEALSVDGAKEEILGENVNDRKVKYTPSIDAEEVAPDKTMNQPYQDETPKFARTIAEEVDDLIPAYDYEEDDTPPEVDEKKPEDNRPDATDSADEYARYVKTLDAVNLGSETEGITKVVKERSLVEAVPSERISKTKVLGDQAFLNSVTKFKKDNFRTVSVPLVNSGFTADVVGTGAVDLSLLYNNVDQNILPVDYELEKMRVIFRNITGTHPKLDRNNLRNMIHFSDYQLLAYAHLVATLKEVEIVHTCEECGGDFRIVANSSDLILNMPELREKMIKIQNSDSVQDNSLMVVNKKMTTVSGFTIILGHPSYADYIQYLAEVKDLTTTLDKAQVSRLNTMITILPFIRSVVMPNQVHTTNLFQRFSAICLLSSEEYAELTREAQALTKEILMPQFGVKKVVCPHCKKVNSDIEYQNLNDLLFFHFMVTQLLNSTEA